jgi:hypothetical protein
MATHRRGTATWAQRHRSRLDRIYGVPWNGDDDYHDCTDREVNAREATVAHLQAHGLYGSWQVPPTVAQTWRHRRRCCTCGRDAA